MSEVLYALVLVWCFWMGWRVHKVLLKRRLKPPDWSEVDRWLEEARKPPESPLPPKVESVSLVEEFGAEAVERCQYVLDVIDVAVHGHLKLKGSVLVEDASGPLGVVTEYSGPYYMSDAKITRAALKALREGKPARRR